MQGKVNPEAPRHSTTLRTAATRTRTAPSSTSSGHKRAVVLGLPAAAALGLLHLGGLVTTGANLRQHVYCCSAGYPARPGLARGERRTGSGTAGKRAAPTARGAAPGNPAVAEREKPQRPYAALPVAERGGGTLVMLALPLARGACG